VAAIKRHFYQRHKPEDLRYPNQLSTGVCWPRLRGIRSLNTSSSKALVRHLRITALRMVNWLRLNSFDVVGVHDLRAAKLSLNFKGP